MINKKLLEVLEIVKGLERENRELKQELNSINQLNEHLLDKLDNMETLYECACDELDDKEMYITELENELDAIEEEELHHMQDLEQRVWKHWQEIKEQGNY